MNKRPAQPGRSTLSNPALLIQSCLKPHKYDKKGETAEEVPMAVNLRVSVRKEIDRLTRRILLDISKLESLLDELEKRKRIYELLGGDRTVKRGKPARTRARRFVDWGRVLSGLPNRFSASDIVKARSAKGKAKGYLRQVVVKWAKQGKIKRTARGKYQKV
jgi:hypothetical protein